MSRLTAAADLVTCLTAQHVAAPGDAGITARLAVATAAWVELTNQQSGERQEHRRSHGRRGQVAIG